MCIQYSMIGSSVDPGFIVILFHPLAADPRCDDFLEISLTQLRNQSTSVFFLLTTPPYHSGPC